MDMGPSSDTQWADEAQRLLRAYRTSYDYEAHRDAQKSVRRRPFETLETAFQVTCQVMVALLTPRVHPFMRQLSRCLRMKRTYPEVLPAPALSVFISSLHAKFVLDMANFFCLPPFRWVAHRPDPAELLHPLSVHGLEMNLLGAVTGVGLGWLVVTARQVLLCLASTAAQHLPAFVRSWAGPRLARTAPAAAVTFHLASCFELSPFVVRSLAAVLREAQIKSRLLLPTAAACLWRSRRNIPWLAFGTSDEDELGSVDRDWSWDGPDEDSEVPHDLLCPITGQLFVKPAVLHGSVFEERALRQWVASTGRHPILQGVECQLDEIKPARDVEDLCSRLAASRGWVLRSDAAR
eukprot:TRINITY_DN26225_c0_g1_i1.p1 TRINITY_DN26225_c0_g1~~TRINITY_DN26225_c0_g1_i1.p1  ORF type:complete len:373 (+),score=51.25 TRINITY_DN26225_c0_g1_i1:72-1121(+)